MITSTLYSHNYCPAVSICLSESICMAQLACVSSLNYFTYKKGNFWFLPQLAGIYSRDLYILETSTQ
jgi:hypothetical protein